MVDAAPSSSDDGGSESDRIDLEPDLPPGFEPEEGGPVRRSMKKQSAVQQDSTIPLGWKPTVRAPVPVVRCHYVWPDGHARGGDRCGRWSLRGSRLCYRHSGNGNLRNVEEYRQAIIEAARLQLTEAVPDALQTVFDLAANSPADNVRLKAATEILDRAGLKGAAELNVTVEHIEANPATTLAERLGKLRSAADTIRAKEEEAELLRQAAATAALEITAGVSYIDTADTEVIEGEILPDPDNGG